MDEYEYLLPQFQVNKAYRPQKRKRGGLAGIWDRNKGVITPLATLAAGAIGGPAAAAALGAAMGGLDRPGKRGIGLDAGGAVRGGLQGYTMGKVGQYGAGKLKGLFAPTSAAAASPEVAFDAASGKWVPKGTEFNPISSSPANFQPTTLAEMPGSAAVQAPNMTVSAAVQAPNMTVSTLRPLPAPRDMVDTFNFSNNAMRAPITGVPASAVAQLPTQVAQQSMNTNLSSLLSGARRSASSFGRSAWDLAKENPEITSGVLQGLIGAYGSAQEREMERELINRQRAQQERLAALLMPMYTQYGGFGG